MGRVNEFEKEMLVIGVLSSGLSLRTSAESELEKVLRESFGPILIKSDVHPFIWSHYYDEEMGETISRVFYAFRELVNPQDLWKIKILTNSLEDKYACGGKRPVNLDPGLLSLNRLILATTKNTAHRIPLSGGIYAELTLLYRSGCFHPLDWTYPDYASAEFLPFFLDLRGRYKQIRRQ